MGAVYAQSSSSLGGYGDSSSSFTDWWSAPSCIRFIALLNAIRLGDLLFCYSIRHLRMPPCRAPGYIAGEPSDTGVSRQELQPELGVRNRLAPPEPTSMSKLGAKPSSRWSSCLVMMMGPGLGPLVPRGYWMLSVGVGMLVILAACACCQLLL